MRDKDDRLVQVFRERLKNYEQPVKDELWASIEKDLKLAKQTSHTRIWWRYAGIAASFFLILGLGVLYYQNFWLTNNQLTEVKIKTINSQPPQETAALVTSADVPKNTVEQPNISSGILVKRKSQPRIFTAQVDKKNDETIPDIQSVASDQKNEDDLPSKSEQSNKQEMQLSSTEDMDLNNSWYCSNKKRKKTQIMSYALAVGNSGNAFSGSNEYGNAPLYYCDIPKSSEYFALSSNKENFRPSSTDYSYNLPVSAGMTVQKYFSEHFAVESGLIYTYLSSEERINADNSPTIKDVQLHYLGIPAKLIYSFYHTNRLSLYASGGGMMEKSIYGKEKISRAGIIQTDKLNIPELQWSLSGGIGLNYQLIDHFGLFIEPGVGYYFDDGSDVMTIRKDTPFNFTFQAGVRLTY